MPKRDTESKQPKLTPRLASRQNREQKQRRQLLIGSAVVVGLVVILILFSVILEFLIIPNQAIATVNGEKLTTDEFQTRTRYERNQLVNRYYQTYQTLQMFGSDLNTISYFENSLQQIEDQLDPQSFGQQVLDLMVDEILIRQEAEKRGIIVTDEEVKNNLQEDFGYYPDGAAPTATTAPTMMPTSTFSAQQLSLVTLTPTPAYPPTATGDPAAVPTATPVLTPTATATPFTLEAYETQYSEALGILKDQVNLKEADLLNIVKSQLFLTKVQESLTAGLPMTQEQVWARHILVDDAITARNILELLANGDDFGELAKTYSTDTASGALGGDLGWFGRGQMVEVFENAAFSLEIGEISEAIESDFGFHIIQVLGHEDRPLSSSAFEQEKQRIIQTWLEENRATATIEINDKWMDYVEAVPNIVPGTTSAVMDQLRQSLAPTPTPIATGPSE